MPDQIGNERLEALLMVQVALLAHRATESATLGPDQETRLFRLLASGGFKGAEIARIFDVSHPTVSRRLKG